MASQNVNNHNDAECAKVSNATSSTSYTNDMLYTFFKCGLLYLYHIILEHFGYNTAHFKFTSFLFLTPLAKIIHFNNLSTRDDKVNYMYSIFNDTILAFIYFQFFVPYLTGGYFSFFPIIVSAVFILLEGLQYKIRDGTSTYEILSTGRIQDNLLAPVVCTTFYYVSQNTDFMNHRMSTSNSFLVFVLLLVTFDVTFGISHHLLHEVPKLWKLHSLHHQYKKERLNAFANFYSDLWDAIITNTSLFVTAILLVVAFGEFHTSFMEVIFAAASSHLKFVDRQMHLMYFFEWDMIDMILKKTRMSSFHAEHHHDSNVNYSLFGVFSDNMVKKVVPLEAFFTSGAQKQVKKVD